VLSIVAYVLKGVIMCWEKDVICALNSGICAQGSDNVLGKRRECALNSGIGAQRSDNVLGKRCECALNSGIGAQGSDMCSKMWYMCSKE
jgi:hypothetical protein